MSTRAYARAILPALMFTFLLSSCLTYRSYYIGPSEVFKSKRLKTNTKHYQFYVHDKSGKTYATDSITINDSAFIARVTETEEVILEKVLNTPKQKTKKTQVHIFLNKSDLIQKKTIELKKEDMAEAAVYALDEKKLAGDVAISAGAIALTVILIVTAIVILFIMMINALSKSTGCFIATMVYGDYDSPEVLVLRRYRDEVLASTVPGIIFIKIYYFFSPGLARGLGRIGLAKWLIRRGLDKLVHRLKKSRAW